MDSYLVESDDIRREIAITRSMICRCEEKLNSLNAAWQNGSLKESVSAHDILTAKELEIFSLLRKGLINSMIAKELFLSERTVETHISSILKKLSCRNRTELLQVK